MHLPAWPGTGSTTLTSNQAHMPILILLAFVLAMSSSRGFRSALLAPARSGQGVSSMDMMLEGFEGRTAFLSEKPDVYFKTCLRFAIEGCVAALQDGKELIEVEFPPLLKNDISVGETLDTNRLFVKDIAKSFETYGKDLWVVFPDAKEASLAKEKWGKVEQKFTLTSIQGAQIAPPELQPKLIIAVNPGFNIEEWIELPKIRRGSCPMIVVNGNIDRLRNGYYPSLFYPGLTKVTKSFYLDFVQALFLSPVAVGGDRFGSWLVNKYGSKWELLVKSTNTKSITYNVIQRTEKYPDAKSCWSLAKKKYTEDRGLNSWGI